uniref:Uncharacterized protein n=1 Tax=Siphoviridae sp. ct4me22 TaxID=2826290 RepID=A0A8S5MRA1_9CAUD|nr:MAG TPA: hypothetical protein [Siphoviridae sp. ct4me22]
MLFDFVGTSRSSFNYPFDFAFFTRKTPRRSTVTVILEILTAPGSFFSSNRTFLMCDRVRLSFPIFIYID